MRPIHAQRGWLLVSLIVLLSTVLLGAVGLSFLLAAHLRVTSHHQNTARTVALAQAGLMRAIFDFREPSGGTGFTLGTTIVEDGPGADDDVNILEATAGDVLLANMKPAVIPNRSNLCGSPRHRLTGWRLRNVLLSAAPAVAIDQIAVNWGNPNDATERIIRIVLGGSQVWPLPAGACGSVARNTWITLPADFALAPGAVVTGANAVWFSTDTFRSPATGASWSLTKGFIDVSFLMTDGSARVTRFLDPTAVADRGSQFTVTSVGRAGRGPFPFANCRRLQVEYEACGAATATSQCDQEQEEREQTGQLLVYRELAQACP